VKALVLGGSGMLGHTLARVFAERFDTYATVREGRSGLTLPPERLVTGVAAESFDSVERAFAEVKPDVVVNCIGIVKQLDAAHDPVPSISVNALFPHRLAELARAADTRMIHVSTDCVFSGRRGAYTEDDEPDPVDLYGRTKLLGEVAGEGAVTVRTSIVGHELGTTQGLLEWFLAQRGPVRGYARAIFSGLTTAALAELLAEVVAEHVALSGVWHVASEPISKLDLLRRFAETFDHDVAIEPDDRLVIDRSLDGTRFVAATGIATPSWDEMLAQLGGAVHAG
jgi:dTDP-4-dehydrorhamnose reductase